MNSDRHLRDARGDRGFSLIEVLIAVTIIVLMGGIVAWNVFGELFQSQRDKAQIDVYSLADAVKMFQMKESRLPNESDWPDFLFNGSPKHRDAYIETSKFENNEVKDPWGNAYMYKKLGSKDFEVYSYGPDSQPGGDGDDADISSRKRE